MNFIKTVRWSLFFLLCSVSSNLVASVELVKQLIHQVRQSGRLAVYELPGMSSLQLPKEISSILGSLVLENPEIIMLGEGFVAKKSVSLGPVVADAQLTVQPAPTYGLNISLVFSLPDKLKLSLLIPALAKLDMFSCKKMKLVIVNHNYVDEISGVSMKEGANLFGVLSIDGPLSYLTCLLGEGLNEVEISGFIVPGVIGSSFSAHVPGKINFIGGIVARDLDLSVTIDNESSWLGLPSCTLGTAVTVDWPGQEPVTFRSSIDLYLDSARLYGAMDGQINNLFGVYGLHAGSWSLGGVVNYAAISLGLIPISEFLMSFELGIGQKRVKMSTKVGLGSSGIGDLAFDGKLEGGFSFDECVDFVGGIVEETPTIPGTIKEYKERIDGYVPGFVLGDVHFFFSPKDVVIEDIPFTKGLIIDGKAKLLGADAEVMIDVQTSGMKVIAYLGELEYGPVKITGPGYDRIMDTPDDGLILDAELSFEKQYCYMGAAIEIDVLGGIFAETVIDISSSGIKFEAERKLFDLFDCGLLFTASLNDKGSPVDFYVKGYMHQTALTALQNILSKAARTMAIKKMHEFRQKKFNLSDVASNVYDGFWNVLASIVGNTFNIKEFLFEASLDELVGKTHLPSVTIKGTVLGKEFELNDISFDLADVFGSVTDVVNMLSSFFD